MLLIKQIIDFKIFCNHISSVIQLIKKEEGIECIVKLNIDKKEEGIECIVKLNIEKEEEGIECIVKLNIEKKEKNLIVKFRKRWKPFPFHCCLFMFCLICCYYVLLFGCWC